jgi:hypothetical protein
MPELQQLSHVDELKREIACELGILPHIVSEPWAEKAWHTLQTMPAALTVRQRSTKTMTFLKPNR